MPPKKKSTFGRKLPKAKKMEKIRKNLCSDAKEELRKVTKEAVKKHRSNMTEKQIEFQQKDLEYRQRKS